jgi:hypothetical protein
MEPVVAALVPTRGDRPDFVAHCRWLISRQTRKIDHVEFVDFPPAGPEKDITKRYRVGLSRLCDKTDVIFLWEDDDWYSKEYVEKMLGGWEQENRPELFGFSKTCYYHICTMSRSEMSHPGRASAMNTLVRADAVERIKFPEDSQPFFDISLWKSLRGTAHDVYGWPCVGIKHGVGLSGGIGHRRDWLGYNIQDPEMDWLRSLMKEDADDRSLDFYKSIFNNAIGSSV